jgi:hypothetical protein
LGKTGQYDPENFTIVLYTADRHPKDILRSFAHELTHHAQACRGDLDDFVGEQGYAQEGKGAELEEEAYKGSKLVRDWEDTQIGDTTMNEKSLRRHIRNLIRETVNGGLNEDTPVQNKPGPAGKYKKLDPSEEPELSTKPVKVSKKRKEVPVPAVQNKPGDLKEYIPRR